MYGLPQSINNQYLEEIMSKFNDYAKKMNEIANGTFEEYRRAEAAEVC